MAMVCQTVCGSKLPKCFAHMLGLAGSLDGLLRTYKVFRNDICRRFARPFASANKAILEVALRAEKKLRHGGFGKSPCVTHTNCGVVLELSCTVRRLQLMNDKQKNHKQSKSSTEVMPNTSALQDSSGTTNSAKTSHAHVLFQTNWAAAPTTPNCIPWE